MRNLILLLTVLVSSLVSAQSFDFNCYSLGSIFFSHGEGESAEYVNPVSIEVGEEFILSAHDQFSGTFETEFFLDGVSQGVRSSLSHTFTTAGEYTFTIGGESVVINAWQETVGIGDATLHLGGGGTQAISVGDTLTVAPHADHKISFDKDLSNGYLNVWLDDTLITGTNVTETGAQIGFPNGGLSVGTYEITVRYRNKWSTEWNYENSYTLVIEAPDLSIDWDAIVVDQAIVDSWNGQDPILVEKFSPKLKTLLGYITITGNTYTFSNVPGFSIVDTNPMVINYTNGDSVTLQHGQSWYYVNQRLVARLNDANNTL